MAKPLRKPAPKKAPSGRKPALAGYLQKILTARVYDVAIESALDAAPRLSARLGNQVLFKREDTQPVFSFKLRGAYNKMAHLSKEALARGVICASAGNHAQGVALVGPRARLQGAGGHADDHALAQGRGGARARRRGRAARRQLLRRLRPRARARGQARPEPSCTPSTIPT